MLTLFHDFTSPASAVAVVRCQRLADEGLPVSFEGFEAIGVDVAVPAGVALDGELDAVAAAASEEGLTLRRPALLPCTGPAHAIGAVAAAAGLGASWRQACYRAFWLHGVDLADAHVLRDLAGAAGLDPHTVSTVLGDPAKLAGLRRHMAGFRREGVGGVPTILSQRTLVPGVLDESDLRQLATLA